MSFLSIIGDAIWAKLEPLLTARLDKVEADVNTQLDKLRTDAMAMLKEALPEMAGAVSEHAVEAIFANTHIDEAANSVSDVFTGIFDQLRIPKF